MPGVTQRRVLRCRVADPLKEALTALADALAKRPAEEILFDWFRSGRLVGELSVLIKRRHPEVHPRLIAFSLATLGKRRRDLAAQPAASAHLPAPLLSLRAGEFGDNSPNK